MKLLISLVVVSLILSGCVAPATYQTITTFNEQHARDLMQRGDNTVAGSALLRQQGGGVVSCAGNEIQLLPATDYAKERISFIYGSANEGYRSVYRPHDIKPTAPPAYFELSHKTQCDAQGNFRFTQVANGTFYVITTITWKVGYNYQGGVLMEKIHLAGNENKNVVLAGESS